MHLPCDLEVQVNGEQTFYVKKSVLFPRCGRLLKVFKKAISSRGDEEARMNCYRVILNDFPGGPQSFECVARFSYGREKLPITVKNVAVLRCVAEFLEMTEEYGQDNLVRQTEMFLSNMPFWSWGEHLTVLKTCDSVLALAERTRIVQRCVDSLAAKASACGSDYGYVSSSPDSVVPRNSTDTSSCSQEFSRSLYSRSWWSEDMSSLSLYLTERIVKAMVASGIDNKMLSKFLLHYLQASLLMLGYSSVRPWKRGLVGVADEKLQKNKQKLQREVVEKVVSLLHSLQRASVSCRSLFSVRGMVTSLDASEKCRKEVEEMIGSQLEKAKLDNLLVPAYPLRSSCIYDVDLVLRLVLLFLENQAKPLSARDYVLQANYKSSRSDAVSSSTSLKMVGSLIDKYLAEVAADPSLKVVKFQALAEVLPEHARASHDGLYRAMDIFLEAHLTTTSEEAVHLSKLINLRKLSFEACQHVARNVRLPTRLALQVLLLEQTRLKAAIAGRCSNTTSGGSYPCSDYGSSRCFDAMKEEYGRNKDLVVYSTSCTGLDSYGSMLRRNEELRTDLQKMNSRVADLEKICRQVRAEMRIKRAFC